MRKLYIFILLFTITNLTHAQWTQIGQDIDGEAANDQSGFSLSISSDGNIVAIGAGENDGSVTNSSHVRVFEYSGLSWMQIGNDINGEAYYDYSGIVSLNSNGTVVAIGAPNNDGNGSGAGHVRIYQFITGDWEQLGNDIDGESAEDWSGESISLSSDGNIIAIGASGNDVNDTINTSIGHARVYEFNGVNWVQMGDDIDGEAVNDHSGCSVSLSSNGTILAVGAKFNDGNIIDSNRGHVRVYEYIGGDWVQLGNDIDGEATYDWSGYSVSLNYDGTVVAIGAYMNAGNGTGYGTGHVRIYEYSMGNWFKKGGDIDGEAIDDWFGYSVSLDSTGSIVAIGAYRNDGNGDEAGHVRVFEYSATNWVQIGNDIDGEAAGDYSGYSVSLSSNGNTVAIGAPYNNINGSANNIGHVRVYGNTSGINENKINTVVSVYPNPTSGIINVETDRIESIEILNIEGKQVYTGKETEIDLSKELDGIYIIKVITDKQVITKKIVKQ